MSMVSYIAAPCSHRILQALQSKHVQSCLCYFQESASERLLQPLLRPLMEIRPLEIPSKNGQLEGPLMNSTMKSGNDNLKENVQTLEARNKELLELSVKIQTIPNWKCDRNEKIICQLCLSPLSGMKRLQAILILFFIQ